MKRLTLLAVCITLLSASVFAQVTVLKGNIGKNFKINSAGTWQIQGKVTGNIDIVYKGKGKIIIEGVGENPILQGMQWGGSTKRAVGHVKGEIPAGCTLVIRNLTLSHNKHHIIDFGGPGRKHVYNCTFLGEAHVVNGQMVFGVAPGNMGGNGLLENCICHAGDDGHQVSLPGSEYRDNHLIMYDNGSAFQFGWKKRFKGRPHHADNIKITGNINPNTNGRTNTSDNPGRCVIGGVFNNNGGDIKLTNLDIDIPKYNHLIKMVVGNVKIDDILIQGTTTSVFNYGGPANLKAIAISAKSGGSVKDMVVDLGDEAANPSNHFIKGNVDVTFLKSDGTATVYKGGKLVSNPGDTQKPTVPGTITFSNISQESIKLNWGASTDNKGVTAYDVFMNGTKEVTVSGTSATINALTCNTSYAFKVRAKDAAGNLSAFNAEKSVTTADCDIDDIEAPTAPTELTASNITKTSAVLSWNASSDNIGVTGYKVYEGSSFVKNATSTSTTISGLTCETAYTYSVAAVDAAGNLSAQSASVSLTTSDCAPPGGLNDITDLTAEATACDQVVLAWTDNSTGESGFRVRRKIAGEAKFTTLGDVAANAESYTDNTVNEQLTYVYQVRALENGKAVKESNNPEVTTPKCDGGSTVPFGNLTQLKATASSCNKVVLTWENMDADKFIVRRKKSGTSKYTNLKTVNAPANSYTDNSVAANTTYIYQVRPQKGKTKKVSNLPQVKTPACSKAVKVEMAGAVNIYPNPASEAIKLEFPGSEMAQVNIVDLNGKVLKSDNIYSGETISVESLSTGSYVIIITSEEGTSANRLMIK